MITYGFSIQGKDHIERGVVCQDCNRVEKTKSGHYIGIVADGVGSAAHSGIGSKLAVNYLFGYCNKHLRTKINIEEIQLVIKEGYQYALDKIEDYVKENNGVIDDYDTTLSMVVYDGENIVFGHAGDGGILVRQTDGNIKPVTDRQKGCDGTSVRPLRAGEKSWDFGFETHVASVVLVTDGILDSVLQPVLVNLPPNKMALAKGDFQKNHIYVTASEFFMNPYSVYLNKKIKNPDDYMKHFLQGELENKDQKLFMQCMLNAYKRLMGNNDAHSLVDKIKKYFYAVWAVKNITDDKSVVCIINETVEVKAQKKLFYKEPDWKWRQECYNALLYDQPLPPIPLDDPLVHNKDEESIGVEDTKGILVIDKVSKKNTKNNEMRQNTSVGSEKKESVSEDSNHKKYDRKIILFGIFECRISLRWLIK